MRTPHRTPRAFRSRARRWVHHTKPRLWTWITGNTNARRGQPWQTSAYIILLLLALAVTASVVLTDRGPPTSTEPTEAQ
jgi:hypothetical protein